MIISLNWLKKFTDIDLSVDELSILIGARLVEIESVENIGAKYKDVTIVRVVEAGPLEGTDHLNLTKIDDGGVIKDVERDDKGLVQVVCGAPNVRAGMLAVWLPPSSTVPETYNDTEPFVLSAKNLRGVMSNGMLASAKELDLFDDHTGIVEVDVEVDPGSDFAKVYELDDYLFEIENKSLTHRPDTFGIVGFAREVAAIMGGSFVTPEWLAHLDPTYGEKTGQVAVPKISIDLPELSARYQAVILSGADSTRRSPLLIQTYLARVGVRPINAVVDVTNYLMMVTGQPLHAFDYDKVVAVSGGTPEIHVREAQKDEKLTLLDGREVTLDISDIVIAAGETAIGLAGAMGGANTVIDDTTKTIILESATFNLYRLRATQMRHGIFSEAITRFTKGQPAALGAPVLAEAIELLGEWAGAKRVSDIGEAKGAEVVPTPITISIEQVNQLLGTDLEQDVIENRLRAVEFAVAQTKSEVLSVDPPYWRSDIHSVQDVIEEIGRVGGYDEITPTLPGRDFTAVSPSAFDSLRQQVRSILVRAGANEVLTYSFVHGDLMNKVSQNTDDAYRITNSISPDLQYYRQSLTPSLLSHIHANSKAGYDDFALFELNKFHTKKHDVTEEGVPKELDSLALVITKKKTTSKSAFYEAKKYVEYIASQLGLAFDYTPLEADSPYPVTRPYEPKRSARITDAATGERIGVVGEFTHAVKSNFKLSEYTAGFELSPRGILKAVEAKENTYQPLSKYPSTERDICFQVASDVSYQDVIGSVKKSLATSDLQTTISPIDIYQSDDSSTKNITIRIQLFSYVKTLTTDDVHVVINDVITSVVKELSATII